MVSAHLPGRRTDVGVFVFGRTTDDPLDRGISQKDFLMAIKTRIPGTEIHLIKIRQYGAMHSVTIPEDVYTKSGLVDGFYSAVVAVGPIVVITAVTQNTRDGVEAELRHAFNRAIEEWKAQQSAEFAHVKDSAA
jgi:hypothetical protein